MTCDRSPLLRSIGSVMVVTGITLAAYLVAVLLLGRNLPRDQFGYVSLWIYSMNILGAAALLGYNNAVMRNVSLERMRESRWADLLPPLLVINLVVCTAGALLFTWLYEAPARDAALLLAAASLLGLSLLATTLLQIHRRFSLAQGLFTLWRPVLLVATVLVVSFATASPTAVFAAVAGGVLLQTVLAFRALRAVPRGDVPLRARALLADASVFSGLYVTAMLILRLDSYFLPRFLDLDALGLYSALGFVTLTGYGVASLAVGQVLNPKLASREPVALGRLALLIVGGGGAAGVLLAAGANFLVPLAFGERYAGDHRTVVAVLAAAGVLQVLYALPSGRIGILASKRVLRAYLVVSLGSLAVDAALLAWALPRWGLLGAATATACTWVWRTGSAWVVARLTTAPPASA